MSTNIFILTLKRLFMCPSEFNLVGRDVALYRQGARFKPRPILYTHKKLNILFRLRIKK
jgi:hypothetical protein